MNSIYDKLIDVVNEINDMYEGDEDICYISIEDGKEVKLKARPMKIGARYYTHTGHYEVINHYKNEKGILVIETKTL